MFIAFKISGFNFDHFVYCKLSWDFDSQWYNNFNRCINIIGKGPGLMRYDHNEKQILKSGKYWKNQAN